MTINTSSLLAILYREPDAEEMQRLIEEAEVRQMSAASLAEAFVAVIRIRGHEASFAVERLVLLLNIEIVSFTEEHALLAWEASARFGKGRSPAKLNLGDCLTYAQAKLSGEPLLFKGEDFDKTDLALVWKGSQSPDDNASKPPTE